MKKTYIKVYIIIAIFLSIIGISIAYAALSQQLQIKTTTTVQSSQTSWNVHFKEADGCFTTGNVKTGTMTFQNTSITISNFILQTPGDEIRCYFYIKNEGQIKAKISSINYTAPTFTGNGTSKTTDETLVKSNFLNHIEIHYSDENNPALTQGFTLNAGEKVYCRVRFTLSNSMTTLPTNSVTFTNATYSINFEQA